MAGTRKPKEKTTFYYIKCFCVLIIIIAATLIHFSYSSKIKLQNSINVALGKRIQLLNKNLRALKDFPKFKVMLQKQINVLTQMDHSRNQTIALLKEITLRTPKGIYLDEMERKDNQITIKGEASSLLPITKLIKQLDTSDEIDKAALNSVSTTQQKDGKKVTRFELFIRLKPYKPTQQQGGQ